MRVRQVLHPSSLMAILVLFGAACDSNDEATSPLVSGPSGAEPGHSDGGVDASAREEGGSAPTCGGVVNGKGFLGSQSFTFDGSKRTYELYVPDAYDGHTTYPLVFVFHGDGGSGAGIRTAFDLENTSGGGAIFVYPDGEGATWQIADTSGLKADVGFIDALATDLAKSYCVDTKRISAVGFSKGAYFANQLACLSTSHLRAVVTHAGGGPFGVAGTGTSYDATGTLRCPAPPVAALQVQGTSDGSVDLTEGQKAREHWRSVNGCTASTAPYAPEPCIAYTGCAAERPEVWCQIAGMGHTIWPKNGSSVTWAFLAEQH